jgi:hypothetical protein
LLVNGALRTASPAFASALSAGARLAQLHIVEHLHAIESRVFTPPQEYDTFETQFGNDCPPDSLVFSLLFGRKSEVADNHRQVVLSCERRQTLFDIRFRAIGNELFLH